MISCYLSLFRYIINLELFEGLAYFKIIYSVFTLYSYIQLVIMHGNVLIIKLFLF